MFHLAMLLPNGKVVVGSHGACRSHGLKSFTPGGNRHGCRHHHHLQHLTNLHLLFLLRSFWPILVARRRRQDHRFIGRHPTQKARREQSRRLAAFPFSSLICLVILRVLLITLAAILAFPGCPTKPKLTSAPSRIRCQLRFGSSPSRPSKTTATKSSKATRRTSRRCCQTSSPSSILKWTH